jgi:cytochrome c biogenesis protein ResB
METIRQMHGAAIAFIDQDARWHPRKLERQLERLKHEHVIQAIHSDVEQIDSIARRCRDRQTEKMPGGPVFLSTN